MRFAANLIKWIQFCGCLSQYDLVKQKCRLLFSRSAFSVSQIVTTVDLQFYLTHIICLRFLNVFESTGAIHLSSNYTMFSSSIRSWSGFFKMSEVVLNLRREIRERYPRVCGQLLCGRSSQAQWQQDWFIYQNLFPSKVENGLYVDVGAFHPFKLSNTVFFDQCLGSADKFHSASSCWL